MTNNSIDHANPYTNQVFQDAVIRNDIAVVKLLLKYGIQPKRNERNMQGLTALQQSILDGNGRLAILILEAGADIEAKTSNGWTCLHIASALGDLDMIFTLINHCCDLIALTKNEELPIDLAATRDIKIKLAREMSSIGYSELAQWYMRKLAAREGVCYVLSTDTLLDLACDDKYDRSYSTAYSYYIRRDDVINDGADKIRNKQRVAQTTGSLKRTKDICKPTQTSMWLELNNQDKSATYSPHSSETIESPLDLNKGRRSTMSLGSPQRKPSEYMDSLKITPDEGPDDSFLRFGSLKRNGSVRQSNQSIQRKLSTIELHIDYSNICEEEDECEEDIDVFDEERTQNIISTKSPTQHIENMQPHITAEQIAARHFDSDSRNRNVRFNSNDNANEFCNCPNCKKMGYAFSPDIQPSSRKPITENPYAVSPLNQAVYGMQQHYEMMYAANYVSPQFYVPVTTTNDPNYFSQDKPRKRKKKLFSGIKSMFKDGTKVNRASENVFDDPRILFSHNSMRDQSKNSLTRQRQNVRKSNSLNEGKTNEPQDVNIYSHSQVMSPPESFSEASHSDGESSFHSSTNTITPQENVEEKNEFDVSMKQHNYNTGQNIKVDDGNIFEGFYPYLADEQDEQDERDNNFIVDKNEV